MNLEDTDLKIINQDIALDSYLSTLLDEIPTDIVEKDLENPVSTKVNDHKTSVEAKSKLKHEPIVNESELVVERDESEEKSSTVVNHLSVMPDWAQHEFSALFFKVDQMILATPLTDLLRTIKIEASPIKIPGQPSWFIGLLDANEHRIGVLDTGQLIFGKIKGQQRDRVKNPFKSILISHNGKWGLACDEVLSIGKLEPDKVRWRTMRGKKPWLVGTVKEELTAIIDINQLVPGRKSG